MRRLKAFVAVVLGVVTLSLSSTGTAGADNGNGLPLCSNEEICFWYNSGSFYEKQFWYNADHSGNNFMAVINGHYVITEEVVKDNALEITNKDSACQVFVGNYLGGGSWAWESFPNNHTRYYLRSVNNRNDYHQRCGV